MHKYLHEFSYSFNIQSFIACELPLLGWEMYSLLHTFSFLSLLLGGFEEEKMNNTEYISIAYTKKKDFKCTTRINEYSCAFMCIFRRRSSNEN